MSLEPLLFQIGSTRSLSFILVQLTKQNACNIIKFYLCQIPDMEEVLVFSPPINHY